MKTIVTLTFLLLTLNLHAQTYDFSVESGSYKDLVGSTSLNNGLTWDDPQFEIPIGFDFEYFGSTIDKIYIDEIGLGGFLTADGSATIRPLLIAYGADIIDRGYNFNVDSTTAGSLSNISYLLDGGPGEQVLKIEWNNVGFYSELEDDDISTDYTNFQLWLYEGTNDIEIHVGPNSITQPELCFDDLGGAIVGLFAGYDVDNDVVIGEALSLEGDPAAPIVKQLSSIDSVTFIDGVIPNGTIYKFSKGSSGTSDVQVVDNFSIYPNPTNTAFSVARENAHYNIESITIYDSMGKLITTLVDPTGRIDISAFPDGLYVVRIKSERADIYKLLIKE